MGREPRGDAWADVMEPHVSAPWSVGNTSGQLAATLFGETWRCSKLAASASSPISLPLRSNQMSCDTGLAPA